MSDTKAREIQLLEDASQELNYAQAEWQTPEGRMTNGTVAAACVQLAAELRVRRNAHTEPSQRTPDDTRKANCFQCGWTIQVDSSSGKWVHIGEDDDIGERQDMNHDAVFDTSLEI